MLHLDLFCVSMSKTYSKVIASSLYAISTYESFHNNILLLDSRGDLSFKIKLFIIITFKSLYRRF